MRAWWHNLSFEAKLAVGSSLALLVWLLSGMVGPHAPAESVRTIPLPDVQVERLQAMPHQRMVNVSGLTAAATKADVAAQTAGRVQAIPVERGQNAAKGATLVQLDPADRTIRLRAAEAELTRTRKLLTAGRELTKEGYMAASVLTEREAAYEAARQQVAAAKLDLSYTTVSAPFAGRVEDRLVSVGDYVNVGTPVAVMVDRSDILLVGYVAQADRDYLRTGVTVSATLLNGTSVPARLRAVATDADSATRTYRVEAVLGDGAGEVPTGMSAALNIPGEITQALRLQHDWLVLGDSGHVGVMVADAATGETVVHFQPVTILNDSPDGIWVATWGENTPLLVTRGQAALRDGSKITATAKEAP